MLPQEKLFNSLLQLILLSASAASEETSFTCRNSKNGLSFRAAFVGSKAITLLDTYKIISPSEFLKGILFLIKAQNRKPFK